MSRIVVVALLCGLVGLPHVVLGQGTADAVYEHVGEQDMWGIGRFVDTFDDTPIQWLTFASPGDENSEIRLVCFGGESTYGFFAYADGKALVGPTESKFKIDSNAVIETSAGIGYNAITGADFEAAQALLEQMRVGEEVRIRIITRDSSYTFRLPLAGFRSASDWVLKECNVMLEEQAEKQNE